MRVVSNSFLIASLAVSSPLLGAAAPMQVRSPRVQRALENTPVPSSTLSTSTLPASASAVFVPSPSHAGVVVGLGIPIFKRDQTEDERIEEVLDIFKQEKKPVVDESIYDTFRLKKRSDAQLEPESGTESEEDHISRIEAIFRDAQKPKVVDESIYDTFRRHALPIQSPNTPTMDVVAPAISTPVLPFNPPNSPALLASATAKLVGRDSMFSTSPNGLSDAGAPRVSEVLTAIVEAPTPMQGSPVVPAAPSATPQVSGNNQPSFSARGEGAVDTISQILDDALKQAEDALRRRAEPDELSTTLAAALQQIEDELRRRESEDSVAEVLDEELREVEDELRRRGSADNMGDAVNDASQKIKGTLQRCSLASRGLKRSLENVQNMIEDALRRSTEERDSMDASDVLHKNTDKLSTASPTSTTTSTSTMAPPVLSDDTAGADY